MFRTAFVTSLALIAAAPTFAVEAKPAMERFLTEEVMPWLSDPVIIEAVKTQNAKTNGFDAARIDALDQQWRAEVGTATTPTIDPVLGNAAADFLRMQVEASQGMITEAFIMDAVGLNVAASSVTSDFWQGDEAKFTETYPQGAGAMHFGEIEFDESSQMFQAQLSISITDPESGAVIGAITIGIDAESLM